MLDRSEDLDGAPLCQMSAVDPPGAPQLLGVTRRSLRNGQQTEVREHHASWPVGLGCGALAPRRDLLCHGARAARHAPNVPQAPPGLLGDARRGAVAQYFVAFAESPLQSIEGAQTLGEHGPQLQQMGDVAHGIGDLARRDGPHEPVREPVRLGQRDVEHPLDEARERGGRHAEESGHDLRVEHRLGNRAARGHEHVEILGRRMGHRDTGPAEKGSKGGGVDGERIDERNPVLPGDLDQRQVGHIRPFGVKLGVEGVAVLPDGVGEQAFETLRVDDHGRWCAHRRAAAPNLASGGLVIAAGEMAEFPDSVVVAIVLRPHAVRRAAAAAVPNLRRGLRAEAIAAVSNVHPTSPRASERPAAATRLQPGSLWTCSCRGRVGCRPRREVTAPRRSVLRSWSSGPARRLR